MNAKRIFITTFLMLTFTLNILAQDKYDFAMVVYMAGSGVLHVSYNNAAYQEIPVGTNGDYKGGNNYKSLLEFASSMTDTGWELITITDSQYYVTYYFKKKR